MQHREPAPPPFLALVPSTTLVLHLNIFISAVTFIFFLFNVPRVLVYVANHGSDIFQGFLLRTTTHSRTHSSAQMLKSTEKESIESSLPTLESDPVLKQPWHLPMYFSLRHPVVLMVGHAAAVLFTALYQSSPFTNPARIGLVIASQIPLVYALATKNNLIGLLVGVGYEKLNYLHRHVGRLMVIGANIHALGFIYKWYWIANISQKMALPFVMWGVISLVCFNLLGFLSLHWVRTKSYNIFLWTHVVGYVAALFATCLHRPACIPFVVAGSVLYGLDLVVRVVKTRYATATLAAVPQLGLTRVHIPSLRAGWRPGQHVRLRVLSRSLGFWGMTEAHPFTISSAANAEEGMVLMCKKTGSWTTKMYEMAQETSLGEQGQFAHKWVKVIVEGPYGGIGDTTVPNYSGVMFVVGGSGITFALSAVQDLVLAGDRSRTEVVDVVWSIADPAALKPFAPLFSELVSHGRSARLRVSVFYTRATTGSLQGVSLPEGTSLTAGRPNIDKLLDGLVTNMMINHGTHGAFVAVCGPGTMAKDVRNAVRVFDATLKKAVGGIQFHEEVFGW